MYIFINSIPTCMQTQKYSNKNEEKTILYVHFY